MTKTIKTSMIILTAILAFAPYCILLAYNIIFPDGPESQPLFCVMTVICYAINILLYLPLMILSGDDSSTSIGCSWFLSIAFLIGLLLSADGRRFFGTFSLISHTAAGTSGLTFYALFGLSWACLLIAFITMVLSDNEWEKIIENYVLGKAENTSSETLLRKLAEKEENEKIRKTAINRLTKPSNFEHVLIFGEYSDARVQAVKKITDQEILKRTAKNDEDPAVRGEAAAMLDDDAVLTLILQNDPSPIVRKSAAGKISDEKVLQSAVQNDKDPGVRHTAVRRISDPEILSMITETDSDQSIRQQAFEKVGDPEILKRMLARNPDYSIWPSAVPLIKGQTLLEQIAENKNNDSDVRREAIRRLDNRDLIARIALEDPDRSIRAAALPRVKKDRLITAVQDSNAAQIFTPPELVPMINDFESLKKIARRDHKPETRAIAVSRIPIPSFLTGIALSDKAGSVRAAAVHGISDPEVLRRIIQNDDSMDVVRAAAGRTPETDMKIFGWERILTKDPRDSKAADALRNLYLRSNIAKQIWEDCQHTDHEDSGGEYCCYADHQDSSETYFRVDPVKKL